jgi:hypothetical protein
LSGDVVGPSEYFDGVSDRTINSTLRGAVAAADTELTSDEFPVNASAFAGRTLGDNLKMSQLGTMRPAAIAPAPTATQAMAAANPNQRNTFDCFVSEDSDCCNFIITLPRAALQKRKHITQERLAGHPAESDGSFLGLPRRDVQCSLARWVPRPEGNGAGKAGARVYGDLQGDNRVGTLIESADFRFDPWRDNSAQRTELSQRRTMLHRGKPSRKLAKRSDADATEIRNSYTRAKSEPYEGTEIVTAIVTGPAMANAAVAGILRCSGRKKRLPHSGHDSRHIARVRIFIGVVIANATTNLPFVRLDLS